MIYMYVPILRHFMYSSIYLKKNYLNNLNNSKINYAFGFEKGHWNILAYTRYKFDFSLNKNEFYVQHFWGKPTKYVNVHVPFSEWWYYHNYEWYFRILNCSVLFLNVYFWKSFLVICLESSVYLSFLLNTRFECCVPLDGWMIQLLRSPPWSRDKQSKTKWRINLQNTNILLYFFDFFQNELD